MSTGDERVAFDPKRFMSRQALDAQFFEYLDEKLDDLAARIWNGQRGVFGSATLAADGNDKFQVQTLPLDFVDGDGKILTLSSVIGESTQVQFENTISIVYYVGARFVSVPTGVTRNPRNAVIFYDGEADAIGEKADPGAVVENAGTLEIVVDSIFETGVSHAGRLVTVYLKKPASDVDSEAIERNLVVTWDGSNNKVTTAGLLGQTTVSTTSADYTVVAQGVTVRRNTNLSTTAPYAFIGTVEGAGAGSPPSTFSTTGQIDVTNGLNPDLQTAYNAGRTIVPTTAAGGAVKIEASDLVDAFNSVLHVNREGSTQTGPVAAVFVSDEDDGVNLLSAHPMEEAGGELQLDEPIEMNVTPGILNFTRGGALDLTAADINFETDLVVISGLATGAANRILQIFSVIGTTALGVADVDGGVPSPWPNGETGTATIYRMRMRVGHDSWNLNNAEVVLAGNNSAAADSTVLKVFANRSARCLGIWTEDGKQRFEVDGTGATRISSLGGPVDGKKNALFELNRVGDSDYFQLGMYQNVGDTSHVPIAIFKRLNQGDFASPEAATLQNTDEILFSGTTMTSLPVTEDFHVVLVEDGEHAGELFEIESVDSDVLLTVRTLQGTDPSGTWSGGANVSILEPRMVLAGSAPMTLGGGLFKGFLYNAGQGLSNFNHAGPLRIVGRGMGVTDELLEIWNANRVTDPETGIALTFDGEGILRLGRDWRTSTPAGQADAGLIFYAKPRDTGDADKFTAQFRSTLVDPSSGDKNDLKPSAAVVRHYDWFGGEIARRTVSGRMIETPRLFDHFAKLGGSQSKDANGNLYFTWVVDDDSGLGDVRVAAGGGIANETDGYVEMETNALTNSLVSFRTNTDWTMKESGSFKRVLNYAVRWKFVGASDAAALHNVRAEISLKKNSTQKAGFRYNAAGAIANWQSFSTDVAPLTLATNRTLGIRGVNQNFDDGWHVFYFSMDFGASAFAPTAFCWMTGMSGVGVQSIANFASSGWDSGFQMHLELETLENAAKFVYVDFVELWTSRLEDGDADGIA